MVSRAAVEGVSSDVVNDTGWTALIGTIIGAIVTVIGVVLKWRGDLAALKVKAKQVDVDNTTATATAADLAADNEQGLRADLFELYRVEKRARQDLFKQYQADIQSLRAQLTAQGQELATQAEQLRHATEDNRQLQRQVIALNQQMLSTRTEVQGLQNREYIHLQYLAELRRQGELLHAYEWAEIKDAADRLVPRPVWPALDAIDATQGEDNTE
jgi:hypothetical protein